MANLPHHDIPAVGGPRTADEGGSVAANTHANCRQHEPRAQRRFRCIDGRLQIAARAIEPMCAASPPPSNPPEGAPSILQRRCMQRDARPLLGTRLGASRFVQSWYSHFEHRLQRGRVTPPLPASIGCEKPVRFGWLAWLAGWLDLCAAWRRGGVAAWRRRGGVAGSEPLKPYLA